MDFLAIEKGFSNLERIWEDQSIVVQLFEDSARAAAFLELSRLQNHLRTETDLFAPLAQLLTHIHWDLRGYVGKQQETGQHWHIRSAEFDTRLDEVARSLDDAKSESAATLRTTLSLLASSDGKYADCIRQNLVPYRAVIVTEKKWQKPHVERFLAGNPEYEDVPVLHLDALLRGNHEIFENVYILAAPNRIPANFMRALVLGGAVAQATFITPSWLAGPEPENLKQELAPGLAQVQKPSFRVRGDVFSGPELAISDQDFESFSYSPIHGDFQVFTATGPVECRLIKLAGGYVMPVELGASRVSVLSTSELNGLEVQFRVPGKNLEPGDILFELRDGAEEDFLMDLAQIRMGKRFQEFARGRAEWKSRANERISLDGYQKTVSYLQTNGVSTAANLGQWIENADFTTPRASKDWHSLLQSLDFKAPEITEMEKLGSELRATLIAIGQDARKQMADAVSQQDLERIQAHEVVTKQLDEFGDAIFVLGMVLSLDSEVKSCEQNEIRRVLRSS